MSKCLSEQPDQRRSAAAACRSLQPAFLQRPQLHPRSDFLLYKLQQLSKCSLRDGSSNNIIFAEAHTSHIRSCCFCSARHVICVCLHLFTTINCKCCSSSSHFAISIALICNNSLQVAVPLHTLLSFHVTSTAVCLMCMFVLHRICTNIFFHNSTVHECAPQGADSSMLIVLGKQKSLL